MRNRCWISVPVILLLAGQALAMQNDEIGPRQAIEGTISFDVYYGYLMVAHGSAGPLKDLNFLVDTGANPTVLDPWVARKLHLQSSPATVTVMGGRARGEQATISSLSLGPIHRNDLPVVIEDLSFLNKWLPIHLDGIAGLEVLGQSPFVIDYAARKIHLGAFPALANPLPFHLKGGLAVVDVQVNGARASLMLDTGANGVVLFAPKISPASLKINDAVVSPGKIGDFANKPMTVDSLKVGALNFHRWRVAIVPEGTRDDYAFDGLLSPTALGVTKVAIDMGRGEMAFVR